MKKWQAILTQGAAVILSRSVARATTSGSTLPWDQPLITVSDALWGTPAHAIMTAVIVFAGLAIDLGYLQKGIWEGKIMAFDRHQLFVIA